MTTYHNIISLATKPTSGFEVSAEAQHNQIVVEFARSRELRAAAAQQAVKIEALLEAVKNREALALKASSGEASWKAAGGPDAVLDAAVFENKLMLLNALSTGAAYNTKLHGYITINQVLHALVA